MQILRMLEMVQLFATIELSEMLSGVWSGSGTS